MEDGNSNLRNKLLIKIHYKFNWSYKGSLVS